MDGVAGKGRLWCKGDDSRGRESSEPLAATEVAKIVSLTDRSRLEHEGHVGYEREYGELDTLTFRARDGRTAILVVTGNETFVDHPARRDLLSLLGGIEQQMLPSSRFETRGQPPK